MREPLRHITAQNADRDRFIAYIVRWNEARLRGSSSRRIIRQAPMQGRAIHRRERVEWRLP